MTGPRSCRSDRPPSDLWHSARSLVMDRAVALKPDASSRPSSADRILGVRGQWGDLTADAVARVSQLSAD